jgi:hypothetical protein
MEGAFASGDRLYFGFWKLKMMSAERKAGQTTG